MYTPDQYIGAAIIEESNDEFIPNVILVDAAKTLADLLRGKHPEYLLVKRHGWKKLERVSP